MKAQRKFVPCTEGVPLIAAVVLERLGKKKTENGKTKREKAVGKR